MAALRRPGVRVAPFKVGPGLHRSRLPRAGHRRVPGRNLDPVLVGEPLIGPLFRHGTAGADIAIVEGRDGPVRRPYLHRRRRPAARVHRARRRHCSAPRCVLVVDARGQSHSIAALLHGFSTFDTSIRLAGVILNRVGSPRHEAVLRQACEQAGVPVLGAHSARRRTVGAVAAPGPGDRRRTRRAGRTRRGGHDRLVGRHVDLARRRGRGGRRVTVEPWVPRSPSPPVRTVTVALAAGRAFSFGYAEHRRTASRGRGRGRRLRPADRPAAAEDTAALVLPGRLS